jgi:hypothetical protein
VVLETKRLFRNEAADLRAWAITLPLIDWFVMVILNLNGKTKPILIPLLEGICSIFCSVISEVINVALLVLLLHKPRNFITPPIKCSRTNTHLLLIYSC